MDTPELFALDPETGGPELACQSCGVARQSSVASARAAGWRVWREPGSPQRDATLCRKCAAGDVLTGAVYYDRAGRPATM